jgi:hydroxymethylpyrimidine/phosphomethylpyrimidine kinase
MRQPAPTEVPVVCTVGASDSGGGAGVQADLKTLEAHGVFGASVVSAVAATTQHARGDSTHVLPVDAVETQLDAVLADFDVDAVKTGTLASRQVVETVTEYARDIECPVVVDPVLAAPDDGLPSDTGDTGDAYEALVAEATLVTPNVDEAERLTGVRPDDEAGQRLAGQRLLTKGADAALVTGGHVPGEEVLATLVTPDAIEPATHPRVDCATHGAGAALSAAVAARLASGEPLPEAVGQSLAFVERAVRYAYDVGEGPGAVHHAVDVRNDAARDRVREQVEAVVAWFVERDVSPVVPEVGLQVVGATPYAESPADCAAVEGRITSVRDGVHPNRSVRFGASSHVARFLVAAREHAPALRYAVNCRFDDDVAAAIDALGWDWTAFGPREGPAAESHGPDGRADRAFSDRETPPVAVADRGAVGTEPVVVVVGRDHRTVAERVVALVERLA